MRKLGPRQAWSHDAVAWTVWGVWSLFLVGLRFSQSTYAYAHAPGFLRVSYDVFFLGGVLHLFLVPCWVLWRLRGPGKRLADSHLRREVALTGLGAGEFLRGQLRRDLVPALGPPLVPAFAAAVYLLASLLARLMKGTWALLPEATMEFATVVVVVVANGAIAAAGAAWLLAARCRGATSPGLVLRTLLVIVLGALGPLFTGFFIGKSSLQSDLAFLALAAFFTAAAQVPRRTPHPAAGPAVTSPGEPRLFLLYLIIGLATAIAALAGWYLLLPGDHEVTTAGLWPRDLRYRISGSIPFRGALYALAVSVVLGVSARPRLTRFRYPAVPWPHLLVGSLAVAGGVWLLRVRVTVTGFTWFELADIRVTEVWPWLCLVLPASGMALLSAGRATSGSGGRVAVFSQQLAATVFGMALGFLVHVLCAEGVPMTGRITWGSLAGPLTLLAILAAGCGLVLLARHGARRRGMPPPAVAALAFGTAALLAADGLTWVPNGNIQFNSTLQVGGWVLVISLAVFFGCWKRLERVYFTRL